mmetsp:Transcript_14898/g.32489  ORF Transcript_14898/g.32489 Transcript_14898/m.32489 type:complete len:114 (+) Transcript_14898:288-629(+)
MGKSSCRVPIPMKLQLVPNKIAGGGACNDFALDDGTSFAMMDVFVRIVVLYPLDKNYGDLRVINSDHVRFLALAITVPVWFTVITIDRVNTYSHIRVFLSFYRPSNLLWGHAM